MDQLATMGRVLTEAQRVVDHIEASQLDDPTPCTEWTVRDLLNHITGGADMFAIAASEGRVSDETHGRLMTGDNLGDDYRCAFRSAWDRAMRAYEPPGTLDTIVVLPFGEMPAGVALDIAMFDVATHAWDLAKATGQSTALDPVLLDAAWALGPMVLTDEVRAMGIFGPRVEVDAEAPLQDRLAAFAGRTP